MTVKEFIQWAEGYYGYPYNPIQREEIDNELMEYKEDFIEAIKEEVKHTLSTSFKTPPSVADIEKAKGGAHKRFENLLLHRRALAHNNKKQKLIEDARDGKGEEDYRQEIINLFAELKVKMENWRRQ